MSGGSSPLGEAGDGDGGEAAAALRLSVRKDLFPKSGSALTTELDDFSAVSCVKLETDFEQSIDEIAHAKRAPEPPPNGLPEKKRRSGKRRKRKRRSSSCDDDSGGDARLENGVVAPGSGRRKRRTRETRKVKGRKNRNLVSSSECVVAEVASSDSDDEVLKCSVKLPLLRLGPGGGGGGKPYSHTLSQLSSKKRGVAPVSGRGVTAPPTGKPRSMLGICGTGTKKKSKKSHSATYHSQIVDTNTIKIKIRKGAIAPQELPCSIGEIGQSKCKKKKKSSTPLVSASSGEEYDPSRGDSAVNVGVAAGRPRPSPRHQPRPRDAARNKKDSARKETATKSRERSESSKQSKSDRVSTSAPQSAWGSSVPVPVLTQIFEYVIAAQGTLPTAIRLGRVCRLWHSVACQPVLWRHVELAPYTHDKWKTDFRLIVLLEKRLNMCRTLNLAHWKVNDMGSVVACLVDYCAGLEELNLTGWSRLTPEHLLELVAGLRHLHRLDLSLTSEMGGSGSCLSASSLANVTETLGGRLTHLSLANNTFTALQQILTSIATHCPNLEVLDISGTRATSHPALVPLEALQRGCRRLRVLRAANSQVVLAPATTTQQMEAPGFPCLEELSIAATTSGSGVGEYRLDDEALARVLRAATRLRLLDLRGLTRISDSGLVRVPAWDLQHLFLGMCNVTRQSSSCLELVCEKWAHSLLEVDLAWASATRPLDAAVEALADKGADSKLRILNLCGSSVSLQPVKKVLLRCQHLESINLSSCRALPRGMKRLYTGTELRDLKDSLDPVKVKAKEEAERAQAEKTSKKKADSKSEPAIEKVPERESESSQANTMPTEPSTSGVPAAKATEQPPKSPTRDETDSKELESNKEHVNSVPKTDTCNPNDSTDCRSLPQGPKVSRSPLARANDYLSVHSGNGDSRSSIKDGSPQAMQKNWNLEQFSPPMQPSADSSSTLRPKTESPARALAPESNTPQASPLPRPDTQTPDVQPDAHKGGSWNLEQFRTTPTHNKSEASPLGKFDSLNKQCSPVTSHDCKPSPEGLHGVKQDIKNPNHWNYGNYSPMTRPDGQLSSHNSPYSGQPSPYSTQQSPYSAQQSPYSAQPSPDTSQVAKPDIQKTTGTWNLGAFSPMTKPPSQYSPHPSTHTSPDAGVGIKNDTVRTDSGKAGQYSPLSRQDRHHRSPYSPRPSIESIAGMFPSRKNYSPMSRGEVHTPSVDGGSASRAMLTSRQPDMFARVPPVPPAPPPAAASDAAPAMSGAELSAAWGLDRYLSGGALDAAWPTPGFPPAAPSWGGLPAYDTVARAPRPELDDRWTSLDGFHIEPTPGLQNTFLEQSVTFDSLPLQSFVEDSFAESRVD